MPKPLDWNWNHVLIAVVVTILVTIVLIKIMGKNSQVYKVVCETSERYASPSSKPTIIGKWGGDLSFKKDGPKVRQLLTLNDDQSAVIEEIGRDFKGCWGGRVDMSGGADNMKVNARLMLHDDGTLFNMVYERQTDSLTVTIPGNGLTMVMTRVKEP